jgi:hypothetical protein
MKQKIASYMKRSSTLFLQGTILLIGTVVLAICLFALPPAIASEDVGYYRPLLLGLYVPAVPFFFALYQALKLLRYIDNSTAFSNLSVKALQSIRNCAVIIAAMFTAGSPYIYYVANRDDAPGVLALGLVIVFASIVIAVFATVLEKLLGSVIAIKPENDLTV